MMYIYNIYMYVYVYLFLHACDIFFILYIIMMYIYQDHLLLNTYHHVHPWDDQGHGESMLPRKNVRWWSLPWPEQRHSRAGPGLSCGRVERQAAWVIIVTLW